MQRSISGWQFYVAVWCCRVSYVISTPFFWIKAQGLAGEGRLQELLSLTSQIKPLNSYPFLSTIKLIAYRK